MIVNNGIRAREVRLIDQNGEQLGIKSKREALQLAEDAGLDLVLVAPKARPAVARIMDYGKYRFEMQKGTGSPQEPKDGCRQGNSLKPHDRHQRL